MAHTEENVVPIQLYAGFPDELKRFSDDLQESLVEFLRQLQTDPYSAKIMRTSEKWGEFYASQVGPLVVYWRLDQQRGGIEGFATRPDAVRILAIHSADELRQRSAGEIHTYSRVG